MKTSFVDTICCPNCRGPLSLQANTVQGDHVIEGMLHCDRCAASYPVRKRLPHLIHSPTLEANKAREMEGWVALWKEKGMYDEAHLRQLDDTHQLPYNVGGVWDTVASFFDLALEKMALRGDEMILDVGAGQGWASRYFAEKGCTAVATDIVADETYGLGRAYTIMDYAGVHFEPILADGEKLPFADDTFDFVFFCAALHHFLNFGEVLREVLRVLKPGGRLIATGEPVIGIPFTEQDMHALMDEPAFGITERRGKVYEYWWALRRTGFTGVQFDTLTLHNATRDQVQNWIEGVRINLSPRVRPRFRPIVWLALNVAKRLPPHLGGTLTLHINGDNVFIEARKPAAT